MSATSDGENRTLLGRVCRSPADRETKRLDSDETVLYYCVCQRDKPQDNLNPCLVSRCWICPVTSATAASSILNARTIVFAPTESLIAQRRRYHPRVHVKQFRKDDSSVSVGAAQLSLKGCSYLWGVIYYSCLLYWIRPCGAVRGRTVLTSWAFLHRLIVFSAAVSFVAESIWHL